ncbi:TasA family protein [Halobacillus halophilus]|uniref:TasA family protein n=1 Tax=Halobacillus halophilus TaxID=1570 RepID=UPI001CD27C74|nr:TasA family protein [Halobacillus halophilus]MCA1012281.1 CalY family protein [Halobacillus halophilus]
MGIKKKLGMGVMTGALGLSLIGGGTFAAFNDVEGAQGTYSAGELDLSLGHLNKSLGVDGMVPGDTISRSFEIMNSGNVDIAEVLFDVDATFNAGSAENGGNDSAEAFYGQFKITMFDSDGRNILAEEFGGSATMAELIAADSFDIASGDGFNKKEGENRDSDTITINVEFVEDGEKDAEGEYLQNQYQGNSATLDFNFEATQEAPSAK